MNQTTPLATASGRVFSRLALLSLGLLTCRLIAFAADPAPSAEPENTVTLDTYKVTTAIDTYKEDRSMSSSKMPIDMKDLAATLQVLNTSFINDKVATALDDLYPYIVGMTREGPAAAGFTLRGYTNSATNTMINNLQTDGLPGGASRFGSPTTANVDRVEVLKGPNSVLYGAMNPGGLINIVTKQPAVKTSHSLSTSVGSFAGSQGTNSMGYSASLDSTGPLDAGKHWLYRFIASYEDAPTWRQFDWSKNYYIFPSLTYRFDENTEATLKLEFHREHRFAIQDQALVAPLNLAANVPTDHSLVYQDPENKSYELGDVYNLSFVHHFQNQWTLKFNSRDVQHTDGRRLLENRSINVTTPLDASTITQRLRDTWNRRRYTYLDLNLYGTFGPETFKQTLLFGLNSGYETHNFTRWIFQNTIGAPISVYHPVHNLTTYPTVNSTTGTGPTQIAISKYYNLGAYVSDQISMGKHWRANLGVHTEKYDTKYTDSAVLLSTGNVVNPGQANHPKSTVPSFGLVYEVNDTLSFYASFAKSFKPTPPQGVAQGAPQPGPETANQKEIGMKADFLERKLGVLLSLYDITRENVIEPVPNVFDPVTGIQVYRTLASQSKGVELSLNYQPVPNWQNQVGISYNDAKVTQSAATNLIDAQLANAPKQSANFWTRYNFTSGSLRGFGVGFGIIYTGQQNLVLDNRDTAKLTIPSVTRADLALYYKWHRYDFAVNIYNITDKSYIAGGDAPTDVVPGSPRKITASVRFPF
jgi:iron complex outermembrane receptor protein